MIALQGRADGSPGRLQPGTQRGNTSQHQPTVSMEQAGVSLDTRSWAIRRRLHLKLEQVSIAQFTTVSQRPDKLVRGRWLF